MSEIFNKPKRKRKEKSKRGNTRRITVLLALIVVFSGIAVYVLLRSSLGNFSSVDVFNAPDGDPFTPLCEFESEVYLYVRTTYATYVKQIGDETVHLLGDGNLLHNYRPNGSPYLWMDTEQTQLRYVYNLQTHTLSEYEHNDPNYFGISNTGRYELIMRRDNEASVHAMMIYDAESQSVIAEGQTPNGRGYWSPTDKYTLLFNQDAPNLAQLYATQSQSMTPIELPYEIKEIKGWIDDETVLFLTTGGYLRTFNIDTGDVTNLVDLSYLSYFYAGGIQSSPNPRGLMRPNYPLVAIDAFDNAHIFTPDNPMQPQIVPLDLSRPLSLDIHGQFVAFAFGRDKDDWLIYDFVTVDSTSFVKPNGRNNPAFSPDGDYAFYHPIDSASTYLIQNLHNGETFQLEDADLVNSYRWQEVDSTSYLQYSVPTADDTTIYYLFQPDTRAVCKVGTFYSISFEIIALD